MQSIPCGYGVCSQSNDRRNQETSITKGLAICRTYAKSIAAQKNKGNILSAPAAPESMSQPRHRQPDPDPSGPATDRGQKRSFVDLAEEEAEAGETPIGRGTKHSQYNIPGTCYPRYLYIKTHSATITKDYKKLRQRVSKQNAPVNDIDSRDIITLDIFEPTSKALFLSPSDLVSKAPECCRILPNSEKERSELYSLRFADCTVIHIERNDVEGNEYVGSLLLSDEDKDNMAEFDDRSNETDIVYQKQNVNIKIGEILERDILRQMGEVYKNLEKDQRYIEVQHTNAKSQKTISKTCSCSTDNGSCESDACITEDITRLKADIMGLIRRSKLPEDQKPKLSPGMEIEVDRQVIDALKKTSRSIDHCGYNLDTLYIFVDEETPSEMLKADIKEKMLELNINKFRVVSSHVHEYSKHASGSKVVVNAYECEMFGTLTGFGRLEENKTMVAIISKHLAILSRNKKLYIRSNIQGLASVTCNIMEKLCESPIVNFDIALACIDKKDEHLCDTMYRTEREKETIAGRLCALDFKQMDRLPVYIRGNATGLGRGKISISKSVPVNDEEKHLLMIEDADVDKPFCKEGDSGAMVCADDPDNYGYRVLLIAVVMGAIPGDKGKYNMYQTLKLKEGLEYVGKEIGENINMC